MNKTDRVPQTLLRVASIAFGLMWLAAAVSKLILPLEAWEFTIRAIGYESYTPFAFGAIIAAEVALGVAMVLGAVRGFVSTFVLLGIATLALVRVKTAMGGRLPCGCFSVFAPSSIDGALWRNGVLLAVALTCAAAVYVRSRRSRVIAATPR